MAAVEKGKFALKELSSKEEMPPVVECQFDGYYDPYLPVAQVLWPVLVPTAEGRATAMAEVAERQWAMHEHDPKSHWYYVVDESNGRIAGAAHWYYHETNPYAEPGPKLEAVWWPEGDARDFCTSLLGQVFGPRLTRMNRPHTLLNLMFVSPAYRRRGIGSILMKPGVDKSAEMNVDAFVEATDPGRDLYERFGYRVMYRGTVDMNKENKSNEWKKCEYEMGSLHWWFMWKPPGGIYEPGQTVVPFDLPEQ